MFFVSFGIDGDRRASVSPKTYVDESKKDNTKPANKELKTEPKSPERSSPKKEGSNHRQSRKDATDLEEDKERQSRKSHKQEPQVTGIWAGRLRPRSKKEK